MASKRKKQLGVGELKINKRARQLINQVLKSNRLSYGPFHRKLESMFAKDHHVKHALFTNSGTSALQIALHALKSHYGWKDGDEVIVPAVTFVATSNIVLACRMKPVFVDVDRETYHMDPNLIEKAITKRTRCIIPVHLLGMPADMDPVLKVAKKHKLRIIEDSAQTMFAKYKGKPVGSIGDIGCFSTYTAHLIITGVGGFTTTNDPQLYVKMRSLMNHGRDSIYLSIDDDKKVGSKKLKEIIAKRFAFVDTGYSYRCTELEAALGVAQLEQKDAIVKARLKSARYLNKELKGLSGELQLPHEIKGRENVYMLYGLCVKNEPKDDLVNFLESRNIETRGLFPLVNQPIYKKLFGAKLEDEYPVAKFLNRHGFYIGCHQYLDKKDLDYIVRSFYDYFKKKK